MSKSPTRASNIELLRLVSMLYIVIFHLFCHGITAETQTEGDFWKSSVSVIYIGVICFVLISGYWGIKFSLKGFFRLYIQCVFYAFLIYGIYCVLNPTEFSYSILLKNMIPYQWWFINVYLCLYLISPIINIPLKADSGAKKLIYICLLATVSFIFGFLVPDLREGSNLINFVLIYYIGNYLRHNFRSKQGAWYFAGLYLLLAIIAVLTVNVLSGYSQIQGIVFKRMFYSYNSIYLIACAVLLFLFFSRLQIHSKVINWLSSSTLTIYLLHENWFLGAYLHRFVHDLQIQISDKFLFWILLLLIGIAVCIVCIMVDKLCKPIISAGEKVIFNNRLFIKAETALGNILNDSDNNVK